MFPSLWSVHAWTANVFGARLGEAGEADVLLGIVIGGREMILGFGGEAGVGIGLTGGGSVGILNLLFEFTAAKSG